MGTALATVRHSAYVGLATGGEGMRMGDSAEVVE